MHDVRICEFVVAEHVQRCARTVRTHQRVTGLLLSTLLLDVAPPQYQSLTEMSYAIKSGRVQLTMDSQANPFYKDIQTHDTSVMQLMREVRARPP